MVCCARGPTLLTTVGSSPSGSAKKEKKRGEKSIWYIFEGTLNAFVEPLMREEKGLRGPVKKLRLFSFFLLSLETKYCSFKYTDLLHHGGKDSTIVGDEKYSGLAFYL